MQREIKFRTFQNGEMYFHKLENYMGSSGIINQYVGCDKAIWMQYTGLKDKNGVDIYEGDILVLFDSFGNPENYIIEWSQESYQIIGNGGPGEWLSLEEFEGSEISGNIHENAELL